jgi:hypothetical protein
MNGLENWLRTFVAEFRRKYDALPLSTKKQVSSLDNFSPPCQILALWISMQGHEQQHIYVTRNKESPDLQIKASGPLAPLQLPGTMGEYLKVPWLGMPTEPKEEYIPTSYKEIIENDFISVARLLADLLYTPQPEVEAMIYTKAPLGNNGFIWRVYGNIETMSAQTLASQIIDDAQKGESAKPSSSPHYQAEQTTRTISGYVSSFYPPMLIGKRPNLTFIERIHGVTPASKLLKWSKSNYQGRELLYSRQGLLFIGEPDKTKCSRLFNEIMAITMLWGINVHTVRENDMSEANFKGVFGTGWMMFPSSPERVSLIQDIWSIDEAVLKRYREIPEEKFLELIPTAEKVVAKGPAASDSLVYLLEAFTLMDNSEYMESFIVSWLVIERYITKLWELYLSEESVSGSRKKKLEDWSTDDIIEVLFLGKKINSNDYAKFKGFKAKRNKIAHEGSVTTRGECQQCFDFATSLVKKELGLSQQTTGNEAPAHG